MSINSYRACAAIIWVASGCGSKSPPAADASTTSAPVATADTTEATPPSDALGTETTLEVAADALTAPDGEGDERAQKLEALSRLEVPKMTRSRATLQRDLVTLAFDTAPNAKGMTASVELTVSVCADCTTPAVAEIEGRKDFYLQQIGELHAKNPGLVFEVKSLDLLPARPATTVYVMSYVDDGQTRAFVHTLEAQFADNGFAFRFQAYPRSGFPQSAAELSDSFSRAELEAATSAIFEAASKVLWPPETSP